MMAMDCQNCTSQQFDIIVFIIDSLFLYTAQTWLHLLTNHFIPEQLTNTLLCVTRKLSPLLAGAENYKFYKYKKI